MQKNKGQAWSDLKREEGTKHAIGVRLATEKDIEHVKAMGGYVPDMPDNRTKVEK